MMTDIDPPGGPPAGRDIGGGDGRVVRRDKAASGSTAVGGKPILWRWWLVAAVISLGLWGGIVFLAM